MTRYILSALAIAACLSTACAGSTTSPTTTTTTPARTTETFAGTLGVGDSPFYAFTVSQTGTTDLTLLSLRPTGATTPALAIPVSLSIGTPAGTGCRASQAQTVQPGLAAQLSTSTSATIYCVGLADIGQLTGAVSFTIRIVHP